MSFEYLNEIEKDQIQGFLNNPTMKEAVKKVVLAGIYFNGTLRKAEPANPSRNFTLALVNAGISQGATDSEIGQDIRGRAIGIGLVEDAWNQLENLKKPVVKVEESAEKRAR